MAIFEPIEKFAKPFDPSDGTVSDEEKIRAASDFNQLVEDLFLARLADTSVSEYGVSAPTIEITSLTPGGRYIAHLEIMTRIDTEQSKIIQIREYHKAFQSKFFGRRCDGGVNSFS